ncbi:hypothetical protein Pflav_018760 [Phytohabitans flavus]|uniref:Uncharacterized protein n=1 Tax=Phytohabitans flavus TaxID=1076124 RepID=A0A6F8XNR9_9ACTN|nr:hypothetical protein [Phytohabitans flavus]BCB75466.1 hypothetical protein Pflav_018760 [Phytohabitans flavus]
MTVIAIPQRRHPQQLTGPGRATRRPAATSVPELTVTFTVPLEGDTMSPQAFRLLEVVRDLVERGEGTVTITPTPLAPRHRPRCPRPTIPAASASSATPGPCRSAASQST